MACTLLFTALHFHLALQHDAACESADERALVERTLAAAEAGTSRTREDFRRTTRPRLWHRPGQICVILAPHRSDGGGSYQACFDRSNGNLVEEREHGISFGPTRIGDTLWELVW